MFKRVVFWIGLVISPIAFADTPLVVHTLAPSPQANTGKSKTLAKPDHLVRMAPPTMSVTRVIRLPDGSIQLQCVQQLNPKSGLSRQHTPVLQPNGAH